MPQHEQKSKFEEDQTSSSLEKCKKVKENLETLQVAADWHKHKQNWKIYQDHPVVPKNNAKNWEICETLATGCRMQQHEQKSKFDEDQ